MATGVHRVPDDRTHVLLLEQRDQLTSALHDEPYSLLHYFRRAHIYLTLGYPDLAIADIYKTLLLADEIVDESGEYHDQAYAAAAEVVGHPSSRLLLLDAISSTVDSLSLPLDGSVLVVSIEDTTAASRQAEHLVKNHVTPLASICLAHLLASVGCLRTAFDYAQNALKTDHIHTSVAQAERRRILSLANPTISVDTASPDLSNIEIEDLPDRGHVRREVYPWNTHEHDRLSGASLQLLTTELSAIAPKLEIKVSELPSLSGHNTVSRQLGVFAEEDIEPNEIILRERSLLTASARLHDPLCDACSKTLPAAGLALGEYNDEDGPVACAECDDIVFCSQQCLEDAQHSYHESICGADIDSIAKDVPTSQAVDALYTQLLLRALAMSYTQDRHPLELTEVKWIWGGFTSTKDDIATHGNQDDPFLHHPRTLPFDFRSQVLQPLHLLELLDINIFEAPHDLAETWVYNTLFAKFRGTASARMNPQTGRPEVAAVHPLWCLANHSCDPAVQWEWTGDITFTARSDRTAWRRKDDKGNVVAEKPARKGGIKKGEEVMSHYVDIELDVSDRREWGAGALGGHCQCQRCLWEADETC